MDTCERRDGRPEDELGPVRLDNGAEDDELGHCVVEEPVRESPRLDRPERAEHRAGDAAHAADARAHQQVGERELAGWRGKQLEEGGAEREQSWRRVLGAGEAAADGDDGRAQVRARQFLERQHAHGPSPRDPGKRAHDHASFGNRFHRRGD